MEKFYMLGSCANGAERDCGKLVHLVPDGRWSAVCGKAPGSRSAGWSQPVTGELPAWLKLCPRCARTAVATSNAA